MKNITETFFYVTSLSDFMSLSRNQLYNIIDHYTLLDGSTLPDNQHDYLVAVLRDYRLLIIDKDKAIDLLEARI